MRDNVSPINHLHCMLFHPLTLIREGYSVHDALVVVCGRSSTILPESLPPADDSCPLCATHREDSLPRGRHAGGSTTNAEAASTSTYESEYTHAHHIANEVNIGNSHTFEFFREPFCRLISLK